MNCCWLLILLLLCSGNGNGCGCGNGRSNDCGCEGISPLAPPVEPPRGRGDDRLPPRGFAGFPGPETCGCEEKND
ncbi:MAG: hypothetical protein LUE96_00040 [Lachnospiraceae bacterium]|nr:hypothetical protein [Lachnospiraceae bacterium]